MTGRILPGYDELFERLWNDGYAPWLTAATHIDPIRIRHYRERNAIETERCVFAFWKAILDTPSVDFFAALQRIERPRVAQVDGTW